MAQIAVLGPKLASLAKPDFPAKKLLLLKHFEPL